MPEGKADTALLLSPCRGRRPPTTPPPPPPPPDHGHHRLQMRFPSGSGQAHNLDTQPSAYTWNYQPTSSAVLSACGKPPMRGTIIPALDGSLQPPPPPPPGAPLPVWDVECDPRAGLIRLGARPSDLLSHDPPPVALQSGSSMRSKRSDHRSRHVAPHRSPSDGPTSKSTVPVLATRGGSTTIT